MPKKIKSPLPKPTVQDLSTEQKILAAAKKLFTEKGFHAVKTREIAQEADINLALLNYYFRSKELLYAKVMSDNLKQFKLGLAHLFGNPNMDIYEKFGHIARVYNEEFSKNPELPLFITNAIAIDPKVFIDGEGMQESRNILFEQLKDLMKQKKIKKMHHAHIMMNFMSLVLFPYIMAPSIKTRAGLSDHEFQQIMNERTKLIPEWMQEILKP